MKRYILIVAAIVAGVAAMTAATRYKGDFNNDGKVDLADMVVLAKAINAGNTDKQLHDLNASGAVDNNDLHVLANLILTETLTEDSGFNVGIGGWDDNGEDYGGTVTSTSATGQRMSMSDVNFVVDGPKYDYTLSKCYFNFGMQADASGICGILFNLVMPAGLELDKSRLVELSDAGLLYGTPVIKAADGNTVLRFIMFSSSLNEIKNIDNALGRVYYSFNGFDCVIFRNCQTVTADATAATYVTEHVSNYYDWTYVPIESLSIDISSELEIGESKQLTATIFPENATNPGLEWSSDNEAVASVTQEGLVTVVAEGETTIRVRTTDGSNLEAVCTVTGKLGAGGIDSVFADDKPMDVYDIKGILLMEGADKEQLLTLPQGIYVIVKGNERLKMVK